MQTLIAARGFANKSELVAQLVREDYERRCGQVGNTGSSAEARGTAGSGNQAGTENGFAADRPGIVPPTAKPITYRKTKAKP